MPASSKSSIDKNHLDVFIVILLTSAALLFFLGSLFLPKLTKTNPEIETPALKTYINNKYGYSLQFSEDELSLYDDNPGSDQITIDYCPEKKLGYQDCGAPGQNYFGIYFNNFSNLDIPECVKKDPRTKISSKNFQSLKWTKYEYLIDETTYNYCPKTVWGHKFNQKYTTTYNDKLVLVQLLSNTEEANAKLQQIFSTLKFLDQAQLTADWKTYKNNNYHYSIQYPPSLYLSEIDDGWHINFSSEKPPIAIEHAVWNISIEVRSGEKTINAKNYVDKLVSQQPASIAAFINRKTVLVDGLPSEKVTGLPSQSGVMEVFTFYKGKIYHFSLNPYNTENYPNMARETEPIFDRMLSTFKLL